MRDAQRGGHMCGVFFDDNFTDFILFECEKECGGQEVFFLCGPNTFDDAQKFCGLKLRSFQGVGRPIMSQVDAMAQHFTDNEVVILGRCKDGGTVTGKCMRPVVAVSFEGLYAVAMSDCFVVLTVW